MLTQYRLNQIWWAGFCDRTVRQAKNTKEGHAGRSERLAWMREHVPTCEECQRANKLKNMEERAAMLIGRRADFENGVDLRGAPGWEDAVSTTIRAALARGELTINDLTWMALVAKRYGHPWQESKDT